MKCGYYEQKKCLSCQWITKSYTVQLEQKQTTLKTQLSVFSPQKIFDPIASAEYGFRNKAKMAVLGTVEKPIFGIMVNQEAIDLCDCPLYSSEMKYVLNQLKKLIKKIQLVPYNIRKKRGEIKFVILTEAQNQFMLRLVLRSEKELPKITQAVTDIQAILPQIKVITINIQPEHAAILEGKQEIILTEQQQLPIKLNHIQLYLKKGSFFQTNTQVASKLYKTAHDWLSKLPIYSIWDLFCGVGGFGLHCITPLRTLIGIEINQEAIECAKLSAKQIGYDRLSFQSLDASQFAVNHNYAIPDLILVNPPRRGIGQVLVDYLQQIKPNYILYSSCNLHSLISDLQYLDAYQIQKAQLFDMFPHTEHMEVLVLLKKNDKKV